MGYKRFKLSGQRNSAQKPRMATALQYDAEKDNAPKVIASGQRKIAEQILAEARKHNIPIHEDPALTAALAGVNLGEEIPVELYHVVAEVLVERGWATMKACFVFPGSELACCIDVGFRLLLILRSKIERHIQPYEASLQLEGVKFK